MIFASKESEDLHSMINFLSFIWVGTIIFGFYVFAVKLRFYFNLDSEQITQEGTIMGHPFKRVVCSFNDISSFEVKSKKVRTKYSYVYKHSLGYFKVDKYRKFYELLPKEGIKEKFSLRELNQIGKDISQIVNCQFKEGICDDITMFKEQHGFFD